MTNHDLFSEFPPISKAQWLEQISRDLKGRSLSEFDIQVTDNVVVSPFIHRDDFATTPRPLATQAVGWEIREDIFVADISDANRQALDALEGGAEGLCFWLERSLSSEEFAQLLTGIHVDFIGLHFAGAGIMQDPGMVFRHLEAFAKARGLATETLRGSLAYDPVPVSRIVDWRYLSDLMDYTREKFAHFKLIQVTTKEDAGLVGLLKNADEYLRKLHENGISLSETSQHISFSLSVGKDYLYEIARLRALYLGWFHLQKAWNIPLSSPHISARCALSDYTDDLYSNMIRATTIAMSAVQGGAAALSVLPYDAGRASQAQYPPAFGRRIARNVQHLLKMESSMDEVVDPAAGSYYLETLTQKLAAQAWAEFQAAG